MFSIYAVGVVKGYKRETRALDPRGRRLPNGACRLGGAEPSAASRARPRPGRPRRRERDRRTRSQRIAAAMQPSTGGQIVYFRIE